MANGKIACNLLHAECGAGGRLLERVRGLGGNIGCDEIDWSPPLL